MTATNCSCGNTITLHGRIHPEMCPTCLEEHYNSVKTELVECERCPPPDAKFAYCLYCGGMGGEREACRSCDGEGKVGDQPCSNCIDGVVLVECSQCRGTGKMDT